jgi:SAM-dependent methyltransferase
MCGGIIRAPTMLLLQVFILRMHSGASVDAWMQESPRCNHRIRPSGCPNLSSGPVRPSRIVSSVGADISVDIDLDDDSDARSAFGTREYWDDVYAGRGDFPAEEYSWYYGWETLGTHVKHILLPGIGNDPILTDLIKAKYFRLTAMDYSEYAVERQQDLLSYTKLPQAASIQVCQGDVRRLPAEWSGQFDAVVEKGVLDAVYLSGDGNVEQAVENLHRVLRPGGIFLSVSGVVPEELRNSLFQDWTWLRDGSEDLKAGCFVFRKAS